MTLLSSALKYSGLCTDPSSHGDDPSWWMMLQPRSSPLTLGRKGSSPHRPWDLFTWKDQQCFSESLHISVGKDSAFTSFRLPDKSSDTGAKEIFINEYQCQASFWLFKMSLLRENAAWLPGLPRLEDNCPISKQNVLLFLSQQLFLLTLPSEGWNFPG